MTAVKKSVRAMEDLVFGSRRSQKSRSVFSDESDVSTLKDPLRGSSRNFSDSCGDIENGNQAASRRMRKPRGKAVRVNYPEPTDTSMSELKSSNRRRPLRQQNLTSSPVFKITPDVDPPTKPQKPARKPRNINLNKATKTVLSKPDCREKPDKRKPDKEKPDKENESASRPGSRCTRSSYNFSDFDDYSLLVSEGSGHAGITSPSQSVLTTKSPKNSADNQAINAASESMDAAVHEFIDAAVHEFIDAAVVSPPFANRLSVEILPIVDAMEKSMFLGTSTPNRVSGLRQSLHSDAMSQVTEIEDRLDVLSLSVIEGSPTNSHDDLLQTAPSPPNLNNTSQTPSQDSQLRRLIKETRSKNHSSFHTSLDSIVESELEQSEDLFDASETAADSRIGVSLRQSYELRSRLDSVVEEDDDSESENSTDESENDSENTTAPSSENSENECESNNTSTEDTKCSEIPTFADEISMHEFDTKLLTPPKVLNEHKVRTPSLLTSAQGVSRLDVSDCRRASYIHNQVKKRSSIHPQLDSVFNSLRILTPVKLPGTSIVVSPRSKVLHHCDQPEFIPFAHCYSRRELSKCKKIGEGVFGEVFSMTSSNDGLLLAVKVIPIEGEKLINGEAQKTFAEILPEIVISRELSSLRTNEENCSDNFVHLHRAMCVRGSYPSKFVTEWKKYDKERVSENDSPEMFDNDQLFVVLEFSHGGCDLDHYQFETVEEAVSVMYQVTFALAVAEKELMFEHRDLHLGNVLVSKTKLQHIRYIFDGEEFSVPSHGIQICIIDFTLSRLSKDECTVYLDLGKDETLFQGEGDIQFDVYRKMRENNGDRWEEFQPISNIYWLHFMAEKLIRYKYAKNSQKLLRKLRHFHRTLNDFDSAYDAAWSLASEL